MHKSSNQRNHHICCYLLGNKSMSFANTFTSSPRRLMCSFASVGSAAWWLLLALELVSRPPHMQEPVLRGHLASFSKLLAGGRLEEIKTILGWILDTCRLFLSCLYQKTSTKNGQRMIRDRSTSGETIHTLGARLNHVAFVIPAARHFTGRIRHFEETSYPTTKDTRRIPRDVLEDLSLWLDFLKQAQLGINLNILTTRKWFKSHGREGYQVRGPTIGNCLSDQVSRYAVLYLFHALKYSLQWSKRD
jgi:hypothetical protein